MTTYFVSIGTLSLINNDTKEGIFINEKTLGFYKAPLPP